MRKFIVKYFALNYTILGFNVLRSSTIIYPLFILNAILCMNDFYWIWIPLIISLYFGFIYFTLFPVKWNELDNRQKIDFGNYYYSKMTLGQIKEWKKIKKNVNI